MTLVEALVEGIPNCEGHFKFVIELFGFVCLVHPIFGSIGDADM